MRRIPLYNEITFELASRNLVRPIEVLLGNRKRVLSKEGLQRVLVAAFGRRQWRVVRSLLLSPSAFDLSRDRRNVATLFSLLVMGTQSALIADKYAKEIALELHFSVSLIIHAMYQLKQTNKYII